MFTRPEFMAEIEFLIIRGLVRRSLAAGYTVSINDDAAGHGEWVVKSSRDPAEIIGALCSTGGDLLILRETCGKRVGWVQLVYNGDEDVIADHSDTLPAGILPMAIDHKRAMRTRRVRS